jgi:hypothetical protein
MDRGSMTRCSVEIQEEGRYLVGYRRKEVIKWELTLNALYLLAFSAQYQLAFCGPARSISWTTLLREDAMRAPTNLKALLIPTAHLSFRHCRWNACDVT